VKHINNNSGVRRSASVGNVQEKRPQSAQQPNRQSGALSKDLLKQIEYEKMKEREKMAEKEQKLRLEKILSDKQNGGLQKQNSDNPGSSPNNLPPLNSKPHLPPKKPDGSK